VRVLNLALLQREVDVVEDEGDGWEEGVHLPLLENLFQAGHVGGNVGKRLGQVGRLDGAQEGAKRLPSVPNQGQCLGRPFHLLQKCNEIFEALLKMAALNRSLHSVPTSKHPRHIIKLES
jgi:hypothetical protein